MAYYIAITAAPLWKRPLAAESSATRGEQASFVVRNVIIVSNKINSKKAL
jgi:hypothetical protein